MSLPEPDPAARAHSARVRAAVGAAVEAAGGFLPFSAYMEQVLYAPGLGYYSAGARKFGPGGDFVTAPELTPLFGRCVARVCRRVLDQLGGGVIVEAGGGSGALAASVLGALADAPPERYLLLEVSAELRERQRTTLAREVPALLDRVTWLDRLPEAPLRGAFFANEVLDAIPTERFRRTADGVEVLGVTIEEDRLAWAARPASEPLANEIRVLEERLGARLAPGYVSELNLKLSPWVRSLAACLAEGVLLFVDYGGSRREIYHPERNEGTLLCHYRHRAHPDPFVWPGLQDITAWVDFTRVAEAGSSAGLALAAYGTQAHFLLANGLLEELAERAGEGGARLAATQAVQELLLPGAMGERFKMLAFARGTPPPDNLVMRDMRAALV